MKDDLVKRLRDNALVPECMAALWPALGEELEGPQLDVSPQGYIRRTAGHDGLKRMAEMCREAADALEASRAYAPSEE